MTTALDWIVSSPTYVPKKRITHYVMCIDMHVDHAIGIPHIAQEVVADEILCVAEVLFTMCAVGVTTASHVRRYYSPVAGREKLLNIRVTDAVRFD